MNNERFQKLAEIIEGTIDVGEAMTDPLLAAAVLARPGLNDIARAQILLMLATVVEGDEELGEIAMERLANLREEDQGVVAGLVMSGFHRLVEEASREGD